MNTEPEQLEIVSQETELPTKRADTVAIWDDYRTQAEKLKTTAETLTVTDVGQVAEMKLARATRLALKDLRVTIEKKRKELGEHLLRQTQKINADAKTLKEIIEPLEARLLEQEEFIPRETLRIEDGKREARIAELRPILSAPIAIDLGKLSDSEYAELLQITKDANEARLASAKKEADEAAARAKAEAEEHERIRIENERLKKEAEEASEARRLAEASTKKEREEAAEKARIEKEKADAELARVRAEAEAERVAAAEKAKKEQKKRDDAAKAEREASESKARTEREAREKADAELAAIKAAEAKAEADRKAASRAAAAAPDKEKLIALAGVIRALEIPAMDSPNGRANIGLVKNNIIQLAAWIEEKAGAL